MKDSKIFQGVVALILGILIGSYVGAIVLSYMMGTELLDSRPWDIVNAYIENQGNKKAMQFVFISGAVWVLIAVGLLVIAVMPKSQKLYGDAKFATNMDVMNAGMFDAKGKPAIILGKIGKKFISVAGSLFVMVKAPTRSGKGVGIVIPNLLNWPDSAVVLDLKVENFHITSGFRKKYGQKVYLFNPVAQDRKTHRYNPLGYIREDKAMRIGDVQKIANFLVPTPKNVDPMWSSEARDLFLGIVLYLLDNSDGLPTTFGEVLRQLKTQNDTAEHFKDIIEYNPQLDPMCIASLSNFANKASKERSGVKSSLISALNLWANPLVDAATSANDFDLREIRRTKMTIYLGTPANEIGPLAPLINIFVQQLIDLNLNELPATYDKKGKLLTGDPSLKYQALLLLDEFTAIGKMEILERGVAFIAGYGLRLMPIIQSQSQLKAVYGADMAENFDTNHAAQTVFTPNKTKIAKEVSDELGDTTVKNTSYNYQKGGGRTKSVSLAKRALMLPQELMDMSQKDEIILMQGVRPIKAKKIVYYEDPIFKDRLLSPIELPTIDVVNHECRGEVKEEYDFGDVDLPEEPWSDDDVDDAANAFLNMIGVDTSGDEEFEDLLDEDEPADIEGKSMSDIFGNDAA
jgi:type IV secretion system protein VirD4